MKSFYKIFVFILASMLVFSALNIISVSAESEYIKPEKFVYGDVNLDCNVTVKDATLIQKDLAKITYITAVQKYLADPEGIGYSVKNATSIQKYLANFETSAPWGTELVMASQDEFSKDVSPEAEFEDDCVIVIVKILDNKQYTIQDFPECNLKSIELLADVPETNSQFYLLYLETPGRNNVIEAIKALDYRANIDIKFALPNYIYHVEFD